MLTDAKIKAAQAVAVLRAIRPPTGSGPLVFPNNRFADKPMSENAVGYLLNRAGYHGHHVPHGLRAAFSTITNEWAERNGKKLDRAIIDLMLAHVPKEKVEGVYDRAACMARRREIARAWADMLLEGLEPPLATLDRPAKLMGDHSRRRLPDPVPVGFRCPFGG